MRIAPSRCVAVHQNRFISVHDSPVYTGNRPKGEKPLALFFTQVITIARCRPYLAANPFGAYDLLSCFVRLPHHYCFRLFHQNCIVWQ